MEKRFYVLWILFLGITCADAIFNWYMDGNCDKTLDFRMENVHTTRLYLTSNKYYEIDMDCSMYVTPHENMRFMIHFTVLDVQRSDNCTDDFLEVHDGPSNISNTVPGMPEKLCGYEAPTAVYTSESDTLTLRFVSDNRFKSRGFTMIITEFHPGPCSTSEHMCDNGRCIESNLLCNGYNPCGDKSDCPGSALSAGAIVGIVFASIIFVAIMCILAVVCKRRRWYERKPVTIINQGAPTYGGTSEYDRL